MNTSTLAKLLPAILVAAAFGIPPADAHVSYDMTETITGTVLGDHRLNGVALLPDDVTFTWKRTRTYDCETGQQVATVTSLEYSGTRIQGEGGIYAFMGIAFFGSASAGAGGWGLTTVSFSVSGSGLAGLTHSFSGSGLGTHTITDPDARCAPPVADKVQLSILCALLESDSDDGALLDNFELNMDTQLLETGTRFFESNVLDC